MSVFSYLDITQATKKILREWRDREFLISSANEKVQRIRDSLTRTTAAADPNPVKGGSSSREEKLVNAIDRIDRITKEFHEAEATQEEVLRAWVMLTDEEQTILTFMFIENEDHLGATRVKERFCIEKTEAYKRTSTALERLAHLLFW